MFLNWQLRELNLKIVYCGAALSGKTTNLEQIHERISPARRGELVSLKTNEDRTLYFDFLQLELGKISGLTPKIHLYTVPGQSYYEASRKLVLRGADGVVFVVDSSSRRLPANLKAWVEMKHHLDSMDLSTSRLPVIVQLNKRDLPEAIDPLVLKKYLNLMNYPVFEAVASKGNGVFETLKAAINGVVQNIQKEIA